MSEHHETEIALIALVLGGAVGTLVLMLAVRLTGMAF